MGHSEKSHRRQSLASASIQASLADLLACLARLWSTPAIEHETRIIASARMTHTLARAYPSRAVIRISTRVLDSGSAELIREIVTHEAAHLAAHLRHRRRVRPHGVEWQGLMREAGFVPRVRLNTDAIPGMPALERRPRRYRHECAACGWSAMARTTNRRWRCAACVARGRRGVLTVTRLEETLPQAV